MKTRPKLTLRKGLVIAALATGCADSPEEAFRASIDDACESVAACGATVPDDCSSPAARDALVTELREAIMTEGPACEDAVFELYADYYACFANLSCEAQETDDACDDVLQAANSRIEAICPDDV